VWWVLGGVSEPVAEDSQGAEWKIKESKKLHRRAFWQGIGTGRNVRGKNILYYLK